MDYLLYIGAALCAYLTAGWNPAITLSRAVYKKDIRECGSGNPGFTNFKRSFGSRLAWVVFALDLGKAAIVVTLFASLFERRFGIWQFGAAYTGLIAVLGHAYPVWYGFKGGKGFLVGLSTAFVIDWRVGLLTMLIMVVLLLTTKYMSLSTVSAMLCCPVMLALFGSAWQTVLVEACAVIFIAVRHRENFKRLAAGTESRFAFGSH